MATDIFDMVGFPIYQTVSGSLYTIDYEIRLVKINEEGIGLLSLGRYIGVIKAQDVFNRVAKGNINTYALIVKERMKKANVMAILGELHQKRGFLRGIPTLLDRVEKRTLEKLVTLVPFKNALPEQLLVALTHSNHYNYTTPILRQIR